MGARKILEPSRNDCACFCAWKNRSRTPVSPGLPVARTAYNIQNSRDFQQKNRRELVCRCGLQNRCSTAELQGLKRPRRSKPDPHRYRIGRFIPRASPLARAGPELLGKGQIFWVARYGELLLLRRRSVPCPAACGLLSSRGL